MSNPEIPNFDQAKNYFEERLTDHGATARGVDWKSESAQELRFSQLMKVINPEKAFTLLDYGCGYGALAEFIIRTGYPMAEYYGFDVLESMIAVARDGQEHPASCTFTSKYEDLIPVDYTIASGIFNLKLEVPYETWTEYVLSELHKMNRLSIKGFSFNMLTKYSDMDYMRPHLYYADPCFLFDYCKRNFARNVALLHDYEAYDFTILVRKSLD